MNTKRFLMAAAAILTIFSCTEKESGNENNGPSGKENTPITLEANTTSPVMTTETQQDEVLTLSWNATTNMGTGARIEYTVLIDLKDGSFENACEVPVSGTSHAFTAGELNSLLMDEFGYEADEVVEVDMCVLATIKNDAVEDVISNTVTVTLTTFTPKSTNLYLIGNATTANWDMAYAIPMNPIEGEEGGFTWSGELNAGEFKFLVWNTSWEPSYGPDEENPGKLYLREHVKEVPGDDTSADTYDPKFRVDDPGKYKIIVNIVNLTYSIEKTGGASVNEMHIVGTSVAEPIKMFRTGYTFMKAAELTAGDLYFSEKADLSGAKYWALAAGQAASELGVSLTGENKWNITSGFYHVTLYIKEGKEKADIVAAEPYETIYLIGNATTAGWGEGGKLKNPLPMTKVSTYVQEWEGPLSKGELKFTCDGQEDWMGAWYLASEGNKAPTGTAEPVIFLDKNNKQTGQMGLREFDQKWVISEAGNYKITLDQLNETVIIAKQ